MKFKTHSSTLLTWQIPFINVFQPFFFTHSTSLCVWEFKCSWTTLTLMLFALFLCQKQNWIFHISCTKFKTISQDKDTIEANQTLLTTPNSIHYMPFDPLLFFFWNQFVSLMWLDVMKKDSIHLICLLVVQLNTMCKN